MIKQREEWKQAANRIAFENPDAAASEDEIYAWNQYKKIRNTINNRKVTEDNFKKGKVEKTI